MADKQAVAAPFPVLGILGVVFITLKLLGKIGWSWWWVLAPFWVPVVVFVFIVVVMVVYAAWKEVA